MRGPTFAAAIAGSQQRSGVEAFSITTRRTRGGYLGTKIRYGVSIIAQGRGGNTPCKAMQYTKVRYGDMLLWGSEPPLGVVA